MAARTLAEGLAIATEMGLLLYPHHFGASSRAHLEGVHPDAVTVAELAIRLCPYDGTILPGGGLRTLAQAQANALSGNGILHSLHRRQADGHGHAVDIVALLPGRGVVWKGGDAMAAFTAMAAAVATASAILGIPVRQGSDWNCNGKRGEAREWDWPHFELPDHRFIQAATALMLERREVLGLP